MILEQLASVSHHTDFAKSGIVLILARRLGLKQNVCCTQIKCQDECQRQRGRDRDTERDRQTAGQRDGERQRQREIELSLIHI